MSKNAFESIPDDCLASVAGGTSHTTQLTAMLTQISSSIKDLASTKNQSDPTQMMFMMMMLGGRAGGGASAPAPVAAAPAQPNIIDVNVAGAGYRRGRKGW